MRDEQLINQAMQLGSTLITAIIVMFFIVLAYRKDSITVPVLFKWAVGCLGAALLLPVIALLINISTTDLSSRTSARGSELKGTLMIFATASSPLLFFSSIILALFALLPWNRRGSDPRNIGPTPIQPSIPAVVESPSAISETPSQPHPLD